MAYEIGGRADKFGNRFEFNWVIYKLLDVAEERISYLIIEAVGDDERGVDLWIGNTDGSREAQQCKARCGSEEYWTFGTVNEKGVFLYWKQQLSRSEKITVSLVSPLSFTLFEDITRSARNTNIDNTDLFYNDQIERSGSKTRNLFKSICHSMDIPFGTTDGNRMAVDYFSRMHYRQTPDEELKDMALRRIDMIFSQDANYVYDRLLSWVLTDDILGKAIDRMTLHRMLQANDIMYRNLSGDRTIWPRMMALNNEYRKSFAKLSCGLLNRETSEKCINYLLEGKSLIIHGNAGVGKSGCTENIIDYCSENDIPYIAIKLDKRLPEHNSKKWGEDLGFPASITHCINAVSMSRRAVIILDQLDALRWTQSKSSDAIMVCSEIVDEIITINKRREIPISIVFVCRTYDIEHDVSIKNLLLTEDNNELKWEKVCVEVLEEDIVKSIVGDSYNDMSPRMKDILRIASNLYIWEHLSAKPLNNIETTSELVFVWWRQISSNAYRHDIVPQELESLKEAMVNFCDRNGRMSIPRPIIRNKEQALAYLSSNGILWADESRVQFVHQSILDSFLSERMVQQHYEGKTISEIIGDRSKQTPGRRYQTQLFLQQLADYQLDDFLEVGESLLSSEVRYSIKYAFLEVLAQFEHPDERIKEYVAKKLKSSQWRTPFINTVIRRNIDLVRSLHEKGILDSWMDDSELSDYAVDIIASIVPEYDEVDLAFIKNYALSEDSKQLWDNCFFTKISEGSDAYFELKLSYYAKHPDYLFRIYDIKEMLSIEERRTLRIIALMLEQSSKNPKKNIYDQDEILFEKERDIVVSDYRAYFDLLFPLFPEASDILSDSDWSSRYMYRNTLERLCVRLIKKAAQQMAENEPERLLSYYKPFMGIGNHFYNELILDSFRFFPNTYADYILSYLCDSLEHNSIEDTSESRSKLSLAFLVVSRFGDVCNDIVYRKLEKCVLEYQPNDMKSRYKDRLVYNKTDAKEYGRVYWPFWGYYQLEMLPALPKKRMSKQALDTISMLKRNLDIKHSWYQQRSDSLKARNIVSPLHDKSISLSAWKSILLNPKIADQRNRHWKEEGELWVESSLEEFVGSFRSYTSEHPKEALRLVLSVKKPISEPYIDALYSGLAYSNKQGDYSVSDAETLFIRHKYDLDSFRAGFICEIVDNKKSEDWSESTYNMLCDIALNHTSPQIDSPVVYSNNDKIIRTLEGLERNALNCVRGHAARTIGGLLKEHTELYGCFRSTVEALTEDSNPVIRYASLWCLAPIVNIKHDWAIERMMSVLTKDYRCLAADHMRWVFCRHYNRYQSEITNAIMESMKKEDDRLAREVGFSIAELYMIHNAFSEYIMNPDCIEPEIRRYIIEMLILYLGLEKYKDKAKAALCNLVLIETDPKNDRIWSRVFSENKIDINADKDFVSCVLQSKISRRMIKEYSRYLDRHHCTKEHSRELLDMCKKAVSMDLDSNTMWGLKELAAKLIISIYYNNVEDSSAQQKEIVKECLDIWDLMYEKDIGTARQLTRQLLEV